jgi:ABC-type Zn uptake system ZnuABC Zn-binding protein ZnuA
MAPKQDALNQTRLALAALAACIAQALGEQDAAFQARFEKNLEKAYASLRDGVAENAGAMETLTWTREFLREL